MAMRKLVVLSVVVAAALVYFQRHELNRYLKIRQM
jgi:hypothetical protein